MQLKELIKDIPLYKKIYGSKLEKIRSFNDLKDFPEITKKHITHNFPKNWHSLALKQAINENSLEFTTTSGSTSERMQIMRKQGWWREENKRIAPYLNTLCHEKKIRKAIFTTALCSVNICYKDNPSFEKRCSEDILYLNMTFNPNTWTKEDLLRIRDEIDRFKPHYILADSIYLSTFFKLLAKHQLSKPNWIPSFLIYNYEYVTKYSIRTIKKFWDIPFYISYGSTEFGWLFIQCPRKKYHWITDLTHINFKAFPGRKDVFYLVVTSLKNKYMPFINYNIGDLVTLSKKENCECESNYPVKIDQLMGRAKDVCYSKSGHPITLGEIDNELGLLENQILVYQLDFTFEKRLTFRYSTLDDQDLNLVQKDQINKTLNTLFEEEFPISFSLERSISPSISGKFNIIIHKNKESKYE